ncbi:MAG: amidohydrolase family protein, partial [bacterium]|nr:amidohydrolase family protein [bacterium]
FGFYLMLSECPSLQDIHSKDEALKILAELPRDQINLVTGWHSDAFALTPEDLTGMPPVAIINYCLHGFVVNNKASRMLKEHGIEPYPANPKAAERWTPKMLDFFGRYKTIDNLPQKAAAYAKHLEKLGLYGIEDMQDILPHDLELDGFILKRRAAFSENATGPLKIFADGAVGSSTAALSEGFTNGGTPVLNFTDPVLADMLEIGFAHSADIAIHTIGDLACQQAVRVFQTIKPRLDGKYQLRLEHCQFIDKECAQKAKELGIILSMQPNFSDDSVMYADRLSEEMQAANNPFRMLIDECGFIPGADLIFGSDGMPQGAASAMQSALFPPYAWQKLTAEELLAGYKADPAYGCINLDIDEAAKKVSLA